MDGKTGKLIGIARRAVKFAPMEVLPEAEVTLDLGVAGDSRGKRRGHAGNGRQVTVLSAEAWAAVCTELAAEVPWTFRRANLLVEGLDLRKSAGSRLTIGELVLEVTCEVDPCSRMDEQHSGLTKAMLPD